MSTDKSFAPVKEDKWLLASHLQKAVRRGLREEAAWAAGHLHQVDRAYLAYRLSVIALEDVAAGDPRQVASLVGQTPWGAKRFGVNKDEQDQAQWQATAELLAGLRKDSTPCNWIGCAYWLEEFEQLEGPWSSLNAVDCVGRAMDPGKPWWHRGLLAWRAAGTDRFPHDGLPTIAGAWDDWVAELPDVDVQTIMTGLGARQREAHPIFLPLALQDRRNDPNAKEVDFQIQSPKHGPWLGAAIDSHTRPGMAAIHDFLRQLPAQEKNELHAFNATAERLVARLMFWMDGGHLDRGWHYGTQHAIAMDTRRRWLKQVNGGNGQRLAAILAKPQAWETCREKVITQLTAEPTKSPKRPNR
jgi:hypothetical protein